MSKISELSDGGSLVSSDYLIAVRSGGNVKVRMDQINVDQVDLGDNEFIRLGNSQDLTMVHTSTQSIINQAGIGDLLIQKAGATKLTINASGIDVTGSVTTTGNVGIGTSSPVAILTTANSGPLTLDSNDGDHSGFGLLIEPSTITVNTVNSAIGFASTSGRKYAAIGMQTYTDPDQNGLNFYVQSTASGSSAALTEAMRIDAAGNVGIGTSSPSGTLHISSSAPAFYMTDTTNNTEGVISMDNAGSLILNADLNNEAVSSNIRFAIDGTERMRIDANGRVGIGTVFPSQNLSVHNPTGGNAYIDVTRDNATSTTLRLGAENGNTVVNSLGAVPLAFYTNSTERMRIDSSGNLLVGKSANDNTTAGHRFTASGFTSHVIANDYPLLLNRLSSDGALLTLRKDSVTVGTLGSINSTSLGIESGDGVIYLGGANTGAIRAINSLGSGTPRLDAQVDATTDIGFTANRFRDLYLSGSASIGKTGSAGVILLNRSSDGGAAGALSLSGDDFVMNTGYATGDIVFKNGATEAARIDGGNLNIGRTSSSAVNQNGVTVYSTGDIFSFIEGTSSVASMRFYRDTAGTPVLVGNITTNGTTTAYNTSSDQRLKENIADADDAGAKIDSIQVRKYDWKADGSHQDYGMIAQELLEVAPEAVAGDPESDQMMGVDYSKLVPMMLKEIQSLRARINALEAK